MTIAKLYHGLAEIVWRHSGLTDSALHVHVGLAFMLIASLLTGRSLGSPLPLAIVILAEVGNEVMDYLFYGYVKPDTFSDVTNTIFWPFAIFMTIHVRNAIRPRFGKVFGRRVRARKR